MIRALGVPSSFTVFIERIATQKSQRFCPLPGLWALSVSEGPEAFCVWILFGELLHRASYLGSLLFVFCFQALDLGFDSIAQEFSL